MQRLGNAEYDLLIDGALEDDEEALRRIPLLNPEEKDAMRGRVRQRKAMATPNPAGQRFLKLDQAGRAGGFPTTQGTMVPMEQRGIVERATTAIDEGMSRNALPSTLLGKLSERPTLTEAPPPSGEGAGPIKRGGALDAFARGLAGFGSTVAGAAEFPIIGGVQVASAAAKSFNPATRGEGQRAVNELLEGAIAPVKTTMDAFVDPRELGRKFMERPGQTIADVALTALGGAGAHPAMKGVEGRALALGEYNRGLAEFGERPGFTQTQGPLPEPHPAALGAPPQAIPPDVPLTPVVEPVPRGGAPTAPQEASRPLPPDALTWHGWQEGTKRVPAQDYWRLNEPLEGVTSRPGMVDGNQLRAAGYDVRPPVEPPGVRQTVDTSPQVPTSGATPTGPAHTLMADNPSYVAKHFAPFLERDIPPSTDAIARVGVDVAEPASRFGNAIINSGQQAARVAGQLSQMSGGDPLKVTNWLNSITEGVADVVETQMYTRPRTYNEGRYVTPQMDHAATRHISANRSGYVMALQAFENGGPTNIFKRGTTIGNRRRIVRARETAALKLIWDDRARAIEARAVEIEARRLQIEQELGTLRGSPDPNVATHRAQLEAELAELPDPRDHRYPKLPDAERQHILLDPAMQDFANWFRDEWTPAAESMSNDAGINARLRGPLGGYVSFANRWLDPRDHSPATLRGSGSRSPYDVRPRRPKSAKRATGAAPEELVLDDNLFNYFATTLTDRLTSTTKSALMDQIREAAISTATIDSAAGKVAPTRTVIQTSRGPREVPVRRVTLERLGGRTDDVYFVPEPYAHLFDMATKGTTKAELSALEKVSSAATAQVVVLPAEAVRHAWNVNSAVTNTEWYAQYGHTARAVEALSGMTGKMATALYRAWNLSGPELSSRIQRMADNNALRLSGWPNTPEHQSLVMSAQKGRYNPLRVMKDYVFGYPGLDKGFKGLETRLRIAIEMAMEQMDPSMSDPQYARRINDNLGTYVKEVVPPLAEKLSAVYPFARARTALVKQGLRTATGMDVLGKFNPYIATATAATVMQVLIANKALDDKGRWPWQVPGWKPLSLMMFEWNGRKVSIGADLIVNPLYRAASATGIRQATELALKGTHPVGDYITEMGRGVGNFLGSWSGPLASSLMVAATGSVPYVGPDGKLYNVEEATMSGAPEGKLHTRYKALIKQAIPAMAKGREWAEATGHSPRPTDEPWNTLFGISELFGVAPQISSVGSEQSAQASNYFRTVEDARNVAYEALQRARNVSTDPSLQIAFIKDYIARHTNPSMIVLDGKTPKPANIYSFELALAAFKNQTERRATGAAMGQQPALR